MRARCTDQVILDQWHPLGAIDEVPPGVVAQTVLLDESISYVVADSKAAVAWRTHSSVPPGSELSPESAPDPLPTLSDYGYVWTSLGSPPEDLFEIDEYREPDRRNLNGISIGVHCSAPRSVENFLDMGHFPFVHTHYLGEEPHTEVVDYEVRVDPVTDDLWATNCLFWQPMAAASASGGQMVEYLYRVPHPYCTLLYKSCPADESRMDVVGLFNQPVSEDHVIGHMLLSYIDHESSTATMRRFTQTIFGQDKPILENQYPRLLPLDPRAETPIRADKMAIAYRRWLSDLGVTYGVIPAT